MNDDAILRDISDTALVAAAVRASETKLERALFRDRYAGMLAGERGQRMARRMRHRLISSGVVARTAVLDELILQTVERERRGVVLNLGAGLDTRPYRLPLPKELHWIEADLQGIVDYKSKLLVDEQPRCRLERFGVDLTDTTARRALLKRVLAGQPTLVACEGLVPYLHQDDVAGLASDLADQTDIRWWALDLVGSLFLRWANRFGGRQTVGGRRNLPVRATGRTGLLSPTGLGARRGPLLVAGAATPRMRALADACRLGCQPARLRDAYRKLGLFVLLRRQ